MYPWMKDLDDPWEESRQRKKSLSCFEETESDCRMNYYQAIAKRENLEKDDYKKSKIEATVGRALRIGFLRGD